jgi:superfamily II DNA or RNA helicase/HKD family nuclease
MPKLVDGLYEHVVTDGLSQALRQLPSTHSSILQPIDRADAPSVLARHFSSTLERVLFSMPDKERLGRQTAIVNRLLRVLEEMAPEAREALADENLAEPGARLLSVHRSVAPPRPRTPLATTTLLTRNRAEPSLGTELASEIRSADRIDMLVAYVTLGGFRVLSDALEEFARRACGDAVTPSLRLLTTVHSGTTELAAVEALARLPGVQIKVSYDVQNTRLHAKAWLLHRNTGLHTAYIGSANLTNTALGAGNEWMMKVAAGDQPHVIDKFKGTFETLWNEPEFELFDPGSAESRLRLRDALRARDQSAAPMFFALRPMPFQEEILDRLEAERRLHQRMRNLVVAATGTGKTVVAAFDYQRQLPASGLPPRLLFVAHRRELLEQARNVFRHVMRDGAFGELLGDGEEPERWNHIFATVQSAARRDLSLKFGAAHFEYVVIDECHHAPADSYRTLMASLRPRILLGLTATPERMDGRSLLDDFDGHVAAELRIWHALERQLLVPFEYFGISDSTDLRSVKWERAGYSVASLSGVYTGNEARVDLIVEQLAKRVADVSNVRAIAFCVSVQHAEFMAAQFAKRGIRAMAVHGSTPDTDRNDARRRLQEREVNIVCTCDLYNEGVDLPFVDTLLLLRPTSSPTLFLQQLGRGLRHFPQKASCLVLDFIGQHRAEFRFDSILQALTGVNRGQLEQQIEHNFPFLPSGCVFQLDTEARKNVLDSIKQQVMSRSKLVAELRRLQASGQPTALNAFLQASGFELEDVYRGASSGYSALKRAAGIIREKDPEADSLSAEFGRLLHIDEPARLELWSKLGNGLPLDALDRRRLAMLEFQLHRNSEVRVAEDVARYLTRSDAIREELEQLGQVLAERIPLAKDEYPVDEWPLALHRHYTRQEIFAAVGQVELGGKRGISPKGTLNVGNDRELLFVTLKKSSREFSPTTRYRDHAISPVLFHWETPSIASVDRPSGRRYLESPTNGFRFYLFVRPDLDTPFAFVGPVRYLKHEGDRPIAITWQLEKALPAVLYQQYATLAPA